MGALIAFSKGMNSVCRGSASPEKEATMDADMDAAAFKAAFELTLREPSFEQLVRRFNWAVENTSGNVGLAMAAVNEVLPVPITYEAFRARLNGAA